MPSPDMVLTGLTDIANDYRWLAVTWHALLAALLVAIAAGWRPLPRWLGRFVVAPVLSVSLLAWLSGNPFNGIMFAIVAAVLLGATARFPTTPVRFASRTSIAAGAAIIVFGSTYPHFLGTDSWAIYLYAAPIGLVPCPTLSAAIGMTLLFRNLRSNVWSTTLAGAGFVYGAIGVLWLGVALDWGLLFASAVLAAAVLRERIGSRSVRANAHERTRPLPGDDLIPAPLGTLTHAISIGSAPERVWPWLIQMGAGSRAGWYSYDVIDNGRRRSADRIVDELQHIAVGTLFPAVPGATDGFHVLQFETGRSLVLGWRPAPDALPLMTWAFVLEGTNDGASRLVVRARGAHDYPFYGLPRSIGMPVVRFGHFIMQRKQLLGIASRAESRHATGTATRRSEAA